MLEFTAFDKGKFTPEGLHHMGFAMRFLPVVTIVCLGALAARADHFEYYTQPSLEKAKADGLLKEYKGLAVSDLEKHQNVLPDTQSVFVVVETNDNRIAKMLVQPARLRVKDEQVPMMLVDKYVTFREATERTVKAEGKGVHLYAGSRLHLDQGQIVPEKLQGDVQVVEVNGGVVLKPVGKAKLYVLTKGVSEVVPKKKPKLVVGDKFEPRFFNGSFKLYDDGRRAGVLKLTVSEDGEVGGTYTSDKDGRDYEVTGKIGQPNHSISFEVKYPATKQAFNGFLFTGNAKAIAGTTKLQEREAGFYAERIDE